MQFVDRLLEARLATILGAGDDRGPLSLGRVVGLAADAIARRIHAHGFLGEDVLARCDSLLDVLGTEAGRRRQEHEVDVFTFEDLVEPFEAAVDILVGDHHAIAKLLVAFQVLELGGRLVAMEVRYRDELGVSVRDEVVTRGAGSATASADHRDAYPVVG